MEPDFEICEDKDNYFANSRVVMDPEGSSFQHNFNKEIEYFIDCVANGAECINTAEDGFEIMKILDAIYELSRTSHEVVIK
jgi:predicted dehydrogenase